jgi:hypothetical protein
MNDRVDDFMARLRDDTWLKDLMVEDPDACKHPKCLPEFDQTAAMGLSAPEVQKRWPRFWGVCPDCGVRLVMYASAEHCIMGDW